MSSKYVQNTKLAHWVYKILHLFPHLSKMYKIMPTNFYLFAKMVVPECFVRFVSILTVVVYFFLFIFVAVPPDIVYDDTSGDISVSEGDNTTLWCKATGHPTPKITWRRENGESIIIRKGSREAIRGMILRIIIFFFGS